MMTMMKPATRPAAVAGMFYPAAASELRQQVDDLLAGATVRKEAVPKALVAPHAGYIYSGPIAANAYVQLAAIAGRIRRVVLLGPVHRVPVRGLALAGVERFATPLGEIVIDATAVAALRRLPQVQDSARAHAVEHSLEVHLPFLQRLLGEFTLVPLAVGDATAEEVAEVLDLLWGGDETLIVVSSDLSHYLPYETARATDAATINSLLAFGRLRHEQACGATPVNGLLLTAARRGLRAELLDLRNSGDTAGDRSRVVGYAAVAVYERDALRDGPAQADTQDDTVAKGHTLLAHARAAIARELRLAEPRLRDAAFLHAPGATFVTLRTQSQLRGCIGSLTARRPLGIDVRENAVAAAFSDPRFRPLERSEYAEIDVEVSLLSTATPIAASSEAELLAQLRAGIDGLTIEVGSRRGTFLPQVWEMLPEPREFVAELKRKAGLSRDFWSDELRLSRYTVDKYTEQVWR